MGAKVTVASVFYTFISFSVSFLHLPNQSSDFIHSLRFEIQISGLNGSTPLHEK